MIKRPKKMNDTKDHFNSIIENDDRSWCELTIEQNDSRLEICEDCPGKEPFCRKNCEIFIEEAYD